MVRGVVEGVVGEVVGEVVGIHVHGHMVCHPQHVQRYRLILISVA